MYLSLPQRFDLFRQNIEPTNNQITQIIGSHTHLRQKVLQQLNYVTNTILTGSYKRKTLIRPLNDVDVFVILNYSINGAPKPRSILQKLKTDLEWSYPNSSIMQDKPCVVLDFNHCKFELTPAIEVSNYWRKSYYIPDERNLDNWLLVEDPDIFEQKLISANQARNQMLIPLVKMMKKCKQYNNIKGLKSFEMEQKAIDNLYWITNYRQGVQDLLGIYQWVNTMDLFKVRLYDDEAFGEYCNKTLFGSDFPQN